MFQRGREQTRQQDAWTPRNATEAATATVVSTCGPIVVWPTVPSPSPKDGGFSVEIAMVETVEMVGMVGHREVF